MSWFNWYLIVLKKYADFTGCATRKEYWFFVLFNSLFMFSLSFLDMMLGLYSKSIGAGVFSGIYTLAVLCPSLAVLARRLHDTGRSEKWILYGFILPVIINCLIGVILSLNNYMVNKMVLVVLYGIILLSSLVILVASVCMLVFSVLPSAKRL